MAEVRAALVAREAADPGLRIRTVLIAAEALLLPPSVHLTYSHPLIEAADADGFVTLAGTHHRI